MQTKPSNRCNCESDLCAAACAHPMTACHKLYHLTLIEAFGIKQTLCEDCLQFAQKRYGKNIVPMTSVEAGSLKPLFLQAHDGHLFACNHVGNDVILTNEHACQTRLGWSEAKHILGSKVVR